jgi:small GTP-binding protein
VTAVAHKVMLLGQIGVGKSSLAQRLVFDRFETTYKPTIGVDVYRYETESTDGSPTVPMIVWDSDGNLGDAMFRHVYLKEAAAAIVIADCTRPDTVDSLPAIAAAFRARLPGRCVCFILNKIDLSTPTAAITMPVELTRSDTLLFRTSAMTGENVKQAFAETARAIARRAP